MISDETAKWFAVVVWVWIVGVVSLMANYQYLPAPKPDDFARVIFWPWYLLKELFRKRSGE